MPSLLTNSLMRSRPAFVKGIFYFASYSSYCCVKKILLRIYEQCVYAQKYIKKTEILSVQAMEAYAKKYHVSGNNLVELFYLANILIAAEAVERLRYSKVNNQVLFHTEKALQYLQLVRRSFYARNDI